jgi:hypothetical protein
MKNGAATFRFETSYLGPQIRPYNLATVNYVNRSVEGRVQSPVRLVSTENIDGWYEPVSQELTLNSTGQLRIDTYLVNEGERIILAGQTNPIYNGIYTVMSPGTESTPATLKRSEGFNQSSQIVDGTIVWVSQGADNAESLWVVSAGDPFTLDVSAIGFTPQSGAATVPPGTAIKLKKNFNPADIADSTDVNPDNGQIDFVVEHNTGDDCPMVQFYSTTLNGLVDFGVNFEFDFAGAGLPYSNNNAFVISCPTDAVSYGLGDIIITILAIYKQGN